MAPGAALAAISALSFGAFFVAIDAAADRGGAGWAVSVDRAASFAALATIVLATIVLRERPRLVQTMGVVYVLYGVGLVTAWGGA